MRYRLLVIFNFALLKVRTELYHHARLFRVSGVNHVAPSEKFLIGQSRKFLSTALRLKDGTDCDEPRGTGQTGVAEAGK